MSAYVQLLDAVIKDLEDRKVAGERCVVLAPETLNALAAPLARSRLREALPLRPAAAPVPAPVAAPARATTAPPAPAPRAGIWPSPPEAKSATPPALRPPAANLAPADKATALAELRTRALACEQCPHLVTSRKSVVFGVGDLNAQLMFVGEAPGADEDKQGEPFVGAAGQLLTKIITAMSQTRQTVYIANVLKCRPDTAPGERGNRKPRPSEMATCLPYLLEQIQLIQPRVIVALGGTAVEGLFVMTEARITQRRGKWMDLLGTPVMPTFHPSYVLRAEDGPDKGRAIKRQVWEDMLQVMERLQMPISAKQRGFFK